jgi:mRNA-degrading endonuclease toxin of MazEF toxin-antitoxin module
VKRGDIWRYEPVAPRQGDSNLRLIVSSDAINSVAAIPVVLALRLTAADPGSLLSVRVGEHGWARALTIEPVIRRRLIEHVDSADSETMEAVNIALRAVQDL